MKASNSKKLMDANFPYALPNYGSIVFPVQSDLCSLISSNTRKDCIFFRYGKCRFNEKCNFKHDPTKQRPDPSTIPCKYDSKNEVCPHGDDCWFSHEFTLLKKDEYLDQEIQKVALEKELTEKNQIILEQKDDLEQMIGKCSKMDQENSNIKNLLEVKLNENETLKQRVEQLKVQIQEMSTITSTQSFEEKCIQTQTVLTVSNLTQTDDPPLNLTTDQKVNSAHNTEVSTSTEPFPQGVEPAQNNCNCSSCNTAVGGTSNYLTNLKKLYGKILCRQCLSEHIDAILLKNIPDWYSSTNTRK